MFRFLLAKLYIDDLIDHIKFPTLEGIRKAFEELTEECEDFLNPMYDDIVERLNNEDGEVQGLAKETLSWITFAKRPLTTLELRHVLAVDVLEFKVEFDEENLTDIDSVISACGGLITVDKPSNTLSFVHCTGLHYFERTWTTWFPTAHENITLICVIYLLFDAFSNGFCSTDEDLALRLQSYPLYDYVAWNWGHHATGTATASAVGVLILRFLESQANVSAAVQAMYASPVYDKRRYRGFSWGGPNPMTGLHLAAFFGLTDFVVTLCASGYNPNVKDPYDWTPLFFAAANGHVSTIKTLLRTDDVQADSKDADGRTPLSHAAANGHEAAVRLLLEFTVLDLDKEDHYGTTPLSRAAERGHDEIVKLLELKTRRRNTFRPGDLPHLISR